MPFSPDVKKSSIFWKLYGLPSAVVALGIVIYGLASIQISNHYLSFDSLSKVVPQKTLEDSIEKPLQILAMEEESKEEAKNLQYQVNAKILNVRSLPTTASSINAKIYQSEIVEVLEIQDNWARISQGWVLLDYLREV